MKKLSFIAIILFIILSDNFGQIQSSVPIVFNDSVTSNRQVIGIKSVQNATDGLNVATFTSGKANFANATGINELSINLPFTPVVVEGFLVYLKAQNVNSGNLTLSINGSPAYAIKKNNGNLIDSAEVQPGQILNLIFNGTDFICLSKLYKPCKNGFVSVSDEYCIDALPRSISSFYPAVQDCGNDDAMLCTWNQWYYACQDSLNNGSGGYLSNFEWVNDAGNNGSDAKVAGFNNASAYAGYGCKKSYSLPNTFTSLNAAIETSGVTIYIRYRCCYRK